MISYAAESQLVHQWRIVGEKSLFVVVIVKWTETDTRKLNRLRSAKKIESRPV